MVKRLMARNMAILIIRVPPSIFKYAPITITSHVGKAGNGARWSPNNE